MDPLPSEPPDAAARPKILVVDDQTANILLVRDLFKDDYEIFMALSGEQAIEQCQAVMPDLILLDLVMPGIDGFEVCRLLKADVRTRAVPIIFVSAQREEADEARGFELGGVDYIVKPVNHTILRARVRTHLALKFQTDLLSAIALVDGLTGVANRRRFDEVLQADWLQCARLQQPISLLMIDVDHFKRFNDRYGHQAGDDCLRRVAQAIKQSARRPHDLTARYGGEEFACILPDTDGAAGVAHAVLTAIRELAIPHAASDVAEVVTASLGVATVVASHESTPQALIEEADRQLYQAKRQGRARACASAPAEGRD
ncbi:diguanylate cyclase response regulator [Chromobacterium sp. ATCC 53434]|uniref:diguanylate cyclase domain-containing protein n=1 Tax=Chromobacterium sp. (strain ATCC 53434 / SC 14030) TaxID=2059672 RepID=UPI000C776AA2|nr:diguanylate cyclase [Chromobacterium sp. ATCC 53434]AUH50502.1 diguanylate cyclase response regulator [Chromobacterium sp. ATCC 53434]